jgi:hypothetical protein
MKIKRKDIAAIRMRTSMEALPVAMILLPKDVDTPNEATAFQSRMATFLYHMWKRYEPKDDRDHLEKSVRKMLN